MFNVVQAIPEEQNKQSRQKADEFNSDNDFYDVSILNLSLKEGDSQITQITATKKIDSLIKEWRQIKFLEAIKALRNGFSVFSRKKSISFFNKITIIFPKLAIPENKRLKQSIVISLAQFEKYLKSCVLYSDKIGMFGKKNGALFRIGALVGSDSYSQYGIKWIKDSKFSIAVVVYFDIEDFENIFGDFDSFLKYNSDNSSNKMGFAPK